MPTALDTRLVVLHHLRLKGFATPEGLAPAAGVGSDDARRALDRLGDDGLVRWRDGRLPGFALTASGRAAHEALVRDELEASGHRAAVARCYRAFLAGNGELVATCTAWQVRDLATSERNDHRDVAYDAAVVRRLERVHAGALPVCHELATLLPRFATYAPRLDGALGLVRAGRPEWFAGPHIDSYHTVWMELHEDLLVTLCIERSSEATP